MNQYYEEKFFESVIKLESCHKFYIERTKEFANKGIPSDYDEGKLDGTREVIRLFSIQTGKPMEKNETITDYYRRWLSMEYSQQAIPDKMNSLKEEIDVDREAYKATYDALYPIIREFCNQTNNERTWETLRQKIQGCCYKRPYDYEVKNETNS